MISMIIVGRLVQRVDARLLILAGLLLTAYSLWEMTAFSPTMGFGPIISNGIIQGLGLGLLFVPLSTLAFATLRPELRTEASSLFSLVRNLGSSVGISIMVTVLAQNTQVNHAELAAHVSPFNPALDALVLPGGLSVAGGSPEVFAYLNGLVTTQAQMIAYLDDFKLMAFVTLACIPMLLLLRRKGSVAAPAAAVAE
jgi:DHA2 family multidrug resistance protein